MSYSSIFRNFVTSAPVWLSTDVISTTTRQEQEVEKLEQDNDIDMSVKNELKPERECCFLSGIICFSVHGAPLDTIKGPKGDSDAKKSKERKISAITSQKSELTLTLVTDKDSPFLNFPFLNDSFTCTHLSQQSTKIMFIMRGLPGSGKSTIVRKIQTLYPQVAVCSADDFFYSSDGVYRNDQNLLGAAHTRCQSKATQACEQGVSTVVIDNTNVRRWEMKFYADLGNAHGYVIVLVQPKTPWQWNPLELARRNKHGVTIDILRKKVTMFDDVIPSYYAWFVNEDRSNSLMKLASKIFSECLVKLPELKNCLLNELNIRPGHISDEMAQQMLSNYYTKLAKKSPLLHCTSRFCGSGKAAGSLDYHKRADVQDSCGRAFDLTITGLIITRRTLGARVTLSPLAVPLFKNAAEEEWNKGATDNPQIQRKNKKHIELKSKKVLNHQKNKKGKQHVQSENLKQCNIAT